VFVSEIDRITIDPAQCGGRPCIRHYRLRVQDVLGFLGAGVSEETILQDYPFLEAGDIRACLQFAASQVERSAFQAA
jgi:uncharacterized protein (DUF433 family)